ncbi:MAG: sodium:proton antiporter [Planctomycetota bacterium]|jgi:Na+/H+ antiporter NhaD/arsenite permease-like protein
MSEQGEHHFKQAPPGLFGWIAIIGSIAIVGWLIVQSLLHPSGHHALHDPPPWWGLGVLPFVGVLGCIAILPLLPATAHWWESNIHRFGVSLGFAGLTVLYFVIVPYKELTVVTVLEHAVVVEYIPFIVLLFSLYVISGGISLQGDLVAKPATNTAFLAVGAAIASFVGTTGASMLLIRPLLQTNSERRRVVHTVVFFIFLVSNIGGCLLPIGDPPLFLGYLFGVPFFWTLGLWAPWLVCCVILLIIYFIWDSIAYRHESPEAIRADLKERKPLRLRGAKNILWLLGVVCSVAFVVPGNEFPLLGFTVFPFLRELLMLGFVGISLWTTPKGVREYNQFNYSAILEVAALFIGIFITMQVPIAYLNARGAALGVNEPWEFFWATGTLSSFLDNAPTYVVFFETAKVLPLETGAAVVNLVMGQEPVGQIAESLLVAISLGAVFLGAMTYIGNGPNFMVKSIAEQSGIPMPSFFGYMFKYSIPFLVPVFILVTFLFLLPWSPLG